MASLSFLLVFFSCWFLLNFGQDFKVVPVNEINTSPYKSVGLLRYNYLDKKLGTLAEFAANKPKWAYGTGSIIGQSKKPNGGYFVFVMTAAHCVNSYEHLLNPAASYQFYLQYNDLFQVNNPNSAAWKNPTLSGALAIYHAPYVKPSINKQSTVTKHDEDWAIIKFATNQDLSAHITPIGYDDWLLYDSKHKEKKINNLKLVGYVMDKSATYPDLKLRHGSFTARKSNTGIMQTELETVRGMSGSPVFRFNRGKWIQFAIHFQHGGKMTYIDKDRFIKMIKKTKNAFTKADSDALKESSGYGDSSGFGGILNANANIQYVNNYNYIHQNEYEDYDEDEFDDYDDYEDYYDDDDYDDDYEDY